MTNSGTPDMGDVVATEPGGEVAALSTMIVMASARLAGATTAADVIDARNMAGAAYTAAKVAERMLRATQAKDEVISALYHVRADALAIETETMRRIANEFDAARDRGEVGAQGARTDLEQAGDRPATAAEVGLSRAEVHDARTMRDVLEQDPEIVRRTLTEMLEAGDEPTRAAVRRAIAPVVKAIREEKQAEKKQRRQSREVELAAKQKALPDRKYGLILCDPEWKFQPRSEETGMDRAAENHYPTSKLEDMMARDVGSIAAKDSVLLMWVTVPFLVEAFCLADSWGFCWIDRDEKGRLMPIKDAARYVSHWAWLKEQIITGYWNRGKHELLLIFTRGKPVAPAQGDQLPSWLEGEALRVGAGEHSAKPEVFLEWIDALWPNTPKIELNRRGPARPGWDAWGNELEA